MIEEKDETSQIEDIVEEQSEEEAKAEAKQKESQSETVSSEQLVQVVQVADVKYNPDSPIEPINVIEIVRQEDKAAREQEEKRQEKLNKLKAKVTEAVKDIRGNLTADGINTLRAVVKNTLGKKVQMSLDKTGAIHIEIDGDKFSI